MPAKDQPSSRAAVALVLFLVLISTTGPARPALVHGFQPAPASALDRALRAGNLDEARRLVPENWAASEQLFVSYLEGAFLSPESVQPVSESRMLASRLADVFFRIVEYDFAPSLVSALDTADAARRRLLTAAARDLFSNLERRRTLPRSSPAPNDYNAQGLPVFRALSGIADRFRELSFPRGELFVLFCMADISPPVPRAHRLARELGDDLTLALVQRQSAGVDEPPWEALLAIAERRGLLHTQLDLLTQLGSRRFQLARAGRAPTEQLEEAVKYLERARLVAHKIPRLETVNFEWYTAPGPQFAGTGLPQLFGAYVALKRLALAEQVLAEALQFSQPFGEDALLNTVAICAGWAGGLLSWDEAAPLLQASQALGAKAELRMARGLTGSGRDFRPEIAEKALALAVAIPDPRERALTLTWYSRSRQVYARAVPAKPPIAPSGVAQPPATRPDAFPLSYDQLFQICLDSGEFESAADALAYRADMQGASGNAAGARDTFNEAIRTAERSGDKRLVALVVTLAATGLRSGVVPGGPVKRWPAAVQLDFAGRAIEAAKAADAPRELLIAYWARATVPTATTDQRLADLCDAVAASERYTEQTGQVTNELRCLTQLSREHVGRGEYQAAIDTERRRAERAHAFEPFEDFEAQAYEEIARIYSANMGEPFLAFEAADRARELVETALAKSYRPTSGTAPAFSYQQLAALAADLGRPVEALELRDSALRALAQHDAESPTTTQAIRRSILASRAENLGRLGDFEAALADWDEVSALLQPTSKSFRLAEPIQKAEWLSAVAWTHTLLGDRDRALALARDAVAEFRRDEAERWQVVSSMASGAVDIEFLIPNPEEVVASLVGSVVDILILTGHPDEAIAFCDLESIRRQLVERPLAQRIHLEHLAQACVAAGQLDRARTLLLSAVEIDRSQATAATGGIGGSPLQLGMLEIGAGNYAKAKEGLLAARAAANPYDFNQIWRIERALAVALSRIGDGDAASAHYESTLTALESVRERLRPEEFRLKYGFDRLSLYEAHATLLATKAVQSGRPADADLAFQAAERKRTEILSGLLATGWARIPSAAMPEQLRRMFQMESRIGAKRALLREQFGQPTDTRDNALVDTLQRELKQLQGDHGRLLASIAQGEYRYAAPVNLAASLAEPVRAALGPSRVLVEYLVTANRTFAFVVSGSGTKVVPLAIGRDALRQQVRKLLLPFRQLRSGELDLARLTYDSRAAHALYQTIFAPLRPSLGPVSEIVIVPDDVLTFLPFDALVQQAPRSAARGPVLHAELAGEKYLLHRYAISYLSSSAQLLAHAGEAAGPRQTPKRFFAMANPAAGRTTPAPAASEDDPLKRQLRSGSFDAFLTPLPGAESEVQRIARHFPGDATAIVTGGGATEAAYESQAGQYSIVHFATHAVASDGQPFYSTMILAPDSAPGHDGFLQAFEVLRTPLQADLVVLSGCETALGAEDLGQGLVGLVAAFQQAGAKSVLATLWSIDEAASEVMAAFYQSMAQGRSTPAALRQAKLQLLKQRLRMGATDVSLAHPFFWAPFILAGAPAAGPGAR